MNCGFQFLIFYHTQVSFQLRVKQVTSFLIRFSPGEYDFYNNVLFYNKLCPPHNFNILSQSCVFRRRNAIGIYHSMRHNFLYLKSPVRFSMGMLFSSSFEAVFSSSLEFEILYQFHQFFSVKQMLPFLNCQTPHFSLVSPLPHTQGHQSSQFFYRAFHFRKLLPFTLLFLHPLPPGAHFACLVLTLNLFSIRQLPSLHSLLLIIVQGHFALETQ